MAREDEPKLRVGQGFDVHRLAPGRRLVLGGVNIPSAVGLVGHSDADVLIHALIDGLLGASGTGDVGELFPDTDPTYKDIDSTLLLKKVLAWLGAAGWRPVNVDLTVIAEGKQALPECDPDPVSYPPGPSGNGGQCQGYHHRRAWVYRTAGRNCRPGGSFTKSPFLHLPKGIKYGIIGLN